MECDDHHDHHPGSRIDFDACFVLVSSEALSKGTVAISRESLHSAFDAVLGA